MVRAVRRLFRRMRIALPQPLSLTLARVAYLPVAVRDPQTRRGFREEAIIERTLRTGAALRGHPGTSERVIEIPWVLRRLTSVTSLLDTGTAFAPPVMQRHLVRLPIPRKAGVDLADFELPGVEARRADIRRLPFADEEFEIAVCLSTLEHIGMDTARYVDREGASQGDDVTALRELGRVAREVLVTVPGGNALDMDWQRQYDGPRLRDAVERAGLRLRSLEAFVHDPQTGWRSADPDAMAGRTYGEGAPAAAAVLCAVLGR
jgi:hypothetical protein